MVISVPATTLLVLCGPPGCGKSAFAARFFKSTATVSSDRCRALVCDHEASMGASQEAFKLFHYNTIDIDQGCAMGGRLTALRYPEREIVQVEAEHIYYKRACLRTKQDHVCPQTVDSHLNGAYN